MFKDGDFSLTLRVLGYQVKDGSWGAHCLETDLVGYGKTFKTALKKLLELTEMQISFAVYKNQPSLLDRPAPPEIIETYTRMVRSTLQTFTYSDKRDNKRRVASIPWPSHPKGAKNAFVQAQAL